MISGGIPQALAVLTPVTHLDVGNCDTLVVPPEVDELGIAPPFPAGEVIDTVEIGIEPEPTSCISTDDPGLGNRVIGITNLNAFPFTEVWYVADSPETSLSNIDGIVSGPGGSGAAFLIDTAGINTPLIFESMTADGIFEPGEFWEFIIQDYSNTLGLLPAAIDSIGVTSVPTDPFAPFASSGSIIAVQGAPPPPPPPPIGGTMIPIDTTALLLAGAQMNAAWMIPVIVVAIGFAIVIARKL